MKRREAVEAFAALRGDAVVVSSPGASSGLLWATNPHPATIYNMELAYAAPVAFGIALGTPDRKVVAWEGDGSLFAGFPALGTIARYAPENLVVVVLANGIWGTGEGNVETTTARIARWPDLALACGWPSERVRETAGVDDFANAVRVALHEPGPWFIVAIAEVSPEDRSPNRLRSSLDAVETADLTRRFLSDARPSTR